MVLTLLCIEKRMLHRFLRSRTCLMIVLKQLIDKVDGRGRGQGLVGRIYKARPWLLRVLAQNVIVFQTELDPVFLNVAVQVGSAQDLGNLHELIIIGVASEKWLSFKYNRRKHASHQPKIKGVIVLL